MSGGNCQLPASFTLPPSQGWEACQMLANSHLWEPVLLPEKMCCSNESINLED